MGKSTFFGPSSRLFQEQDSRDESKDRLCVKCLAKGLPSLFLEADCLGPAQTLSAAFCREGTALQTQGPAYSSRFQSVPGKGLEYDFALKEQSLVPTKFSAMTSSKESIWKNKTISTFNRKKKC